MLTRVTISGADDAVNPADLLALSQEFPFVEWGILLSATRQGTERYPHEDWIWRVASAFGINRGSFACHFCGQVTRDTMDGNPVWLDRLPNIFSRIQLNGYKSPLPQTFLALTRSHRREYILQARSLEGLLRAIWDATDMDMERASILVDPSGGEGITDRMLWKKVGKLPKLAGVGFAGGIAPENLVESLAQIPPRRDSFWIDMESGVRTDNRFDLARVRAVLEKTASYIGKASV